MRDVLFDNATVLDVNAGRLLPDRRVRVQEGTITDVGGKEVHANGARVRDLAGKTLLPGLIDAHVHVTAVTADLAGQSEWSPNYVAAKTAGVLRGMVRRGFTTVRDVGGADYGLADAVDEGLLTGPRVVFGGKSLSQTGGHADMRHRGRLAVDQHRCCPNIGLICDGIPEVRRAAREQLRTGAHHIKLMLSGGVASPTDRVDSTQFAVEEIRAVVEEAEAANRYVTGHAYTAGAINRGLANGVRCIEHGNLLDDSSLELFREHDAFYVPTLVTYQRLSSEGPEHGLPPDSHRKVDEVLDRGLDALERAYQAGVNLVYGTDLLGGMHRHQLGEFAIRAQVQPPIDVIRAATVDAARLLRRDGELGVVVPGAAADLLVVDGDPLSDIGVLDGSRHELVMRAGELHELASV